MNLEQQRYNTEIVATTTIITITPNSAQQQQQQQHQLIQEKGKSIRNTFFSSFNMQQHSTQYAYNRELNHAQKKHTLTYHCNVSRMYVCVRANCHNHIQIIRQPAKKASLPMIQNVISRTNQLQDEIIISQ